MFAAAGRFVHGATAGLARKFHTPKITVARSRERLQRMFQVVIFGGAGRLSICGIIKDFFSRLEANSGLSAAVVYKCGLNHGKLQKRKLGAQKATLKRSSTLT